MLHSLKTKPSLAMISRVYLSDTQELSNPPNFYSSSSPLSQLENPLTTEQEQQQQQCSTNDKLHILVKAQPSTRSTWPRSPTRLGIRLRDLGLLNKYSLGYCMWPFLLLLDASLFYKQALHTTLTATDTTASTKLRFVLFFLKENSDWSAGDNCIPSAK